MEAAPGLEPGITVLQTVALASWLCRLRSAQVCLLRRNLSTAPPRSRATKPVTPARRRRQGTGSRKDTVVGKARGGPRGSSPSR